MELAARLHRAALHLLRRVRREDAAMGLPPGQASALSVLVFGGAATLTELARIEQVRAPTMSRMIDALERRGLARRSSDPRDRRSARIVATAAGVRVMEEGRRRRVQALARSLAPLDAAERALLARAASILENMAGSADAGVPAAPTKK